MRYDPTKHHRRSIRLRGHDYAGGGAYFITICTQDKQCVLGRIAEGQMFVNEAGQIVQRAWERLPESFPGVLLDTFQIMPNHLHAVLVIPGAGLEPGLAWATSAPMFEPGRKAESAPSRTLALGNVVGAYKSILTIEVNRFQANPGRRLLQRNFYEHVIRSVDALEKIRDYIRHNPERWWEDPENPDRPPGDRPETEWSWE